MKDSRAWNNACCWRGLMVVFERAVRLLSVGQGYSVRAFVFVEIPRGPKGRMRLYDRVLGTTKWSLEV